jgi:histidinol-phosphatase (PHP family)
MGFTEIAFTEHLDFDPLDEGYGHYDYEAISERIDSLRKVYGGRLTIRKGVEVTYQKERDNEIRGFLEGKDYDFVMGSVHLVGNFDVSQDKGTEQFLSHYTREDAFQSYFETSLNLVSSGLFDTIGHFEMVRRYALSYRDDYSYGEFSRIIDEVLRKLIAHDTVLEVNTSGLRHLPKETYPRPEIITRYIALGGKRITVGSDAHLPEHIGYRIPETMRALEKMGIRSLTTFDRRVKGENDV